MQPQSLADRYRPQKLSEIRGQPKIVRALKSFIAQPYPRAFIFAGDPGTGKTSLAYALAAELGVVVAGNQVERAMGGFYEIAAGKMDGRAVEEQMRATWTTPFCGSGWKMVLANEADRLTPQAEVIWLDELERLRARTVVCFTTNDLKVLSRRMRDRCEVYEFASDIKSLRKDAEQLIAAVWGSELGHNHAPTLADIGIKYEYGSLSFRNVLAKLEPIIRAEKQGEQWRNEEPEEKPEPVKVAPKRKTCWQLGDDVPNLGVIREIGKLTGAYRINNKWFTSEQLPAVA